MKDGAVRVTFDHAGSGLKSRDGTALKRFEIAGADKVWHWAEAKVDGVDTVAVSSPEVKQPVAVRYAWASNPEGANLVNSDDLPASVFRTDDWDDVEPKAGAKPMSALEIRRTKALEIKALNAKLASLDKGSAEFKELRQKIRGLLAELKATAPKR